MAAASAPSLPIPWTTAGQAALAALVDSPAGAMLVTDYDGTLAPIVDDPAAAVPYPGAVQALARLAPRLGHVAVVTGRPVDVVWRLGGLERVAGLDVLGLYGEQRLRDGVLVDPGPPAARLDGVRAVIGPLLAGAAPGTYVEDKGASLAVHTRRAQDPDRALAAVRPALARIAAGHDLVLEPGRQVLELRAAGGDKGSAVQRLIREHSPSTVVVMGDDAGDLAAFDAVRRWRAHGGRGLVVAVASSEVPALRDAADVTVDGPPGVLALLEALVDQLGG